MIRKLFNILSGKSDEGVKPTPVSSNNVEASGSIEKIVAFVEYIVKSLVDVPTEVKIDFVDKSEEQVINISCKKEDIGKIIGKSGKTIMAIRALVAGAASRINKQVNVEVLDQVAN